LLPERSRTNTDELVRPASFGCPVEEHRREHSGGVIERQVFDGISGQRAVPYFPPVFDREAQADEEIQTPLQVVDREGRHDALAV
jgi:hypothetical protein